MEQLGTMNLQLSCTLAIVVLFFYTYKLYRRACLMHHFVKLINKTHRNSGILFKFGILFCSLKFCATRTLNLMQMKYKYYEHKQNNKKTH